MIPDTTALIRSGKAINLAYADSFLTNPANLDPSGLGLELVDFIWGTDKDLLGIKSERVPYGYLARDSFTGAYHVFIRGTDTAIEWLEDFEAIPAVQVPFMLPGCCAHNGFTRLYTSLGMTDGTPLKARCSGLRISTVNGHSLGGALATLAAVDIRADAILWAAPRVFTPTSAWVVDAMRLNLTRIVNPADLVPKAPPEAMGFAHVGTEVPFGLKAALGARCARVISSYLNHLDPSVPLEPGCAPLTP